MNWIKKLPQDIQTKLKKYISHGIDMSDIYERNGGGVRSQGYLNSKIEMCDRIEGFCTALYLLGHIENPIIVSINDGVAEFRKMDQDFIIRGTPEIIFSCAKNDL